MRPSIAPYLAYEDTDTAIEFLTKAFGFDVQIRVDMKDGSASRAQLVYGNGIVMVGPIEEPRGWSSVYVEVDDLDPHYKNAMAFGAYPVFAPEETDWGTRRYCVRDLEGHVWTFSSHSMITNPSEWPQ
ncbi:MAG: VOC family protein [Pseudomonadota bacterium]